MGVVYPFKTTNSSENRHQYFRNGADDNHDDEDVLLLSGVIYPENTASKSTQIYIDRIDKQLQIGNPWQKTFEQETQLDLKDRKKDIATFLGKNHGLKEIVGSAINFNNDPLYYMGRPNIIPPPIDTNTAVSNTYEMIN